MREYETTIIIQPELSEEGSAAVLSKLDAVLEAGGSTRLLCEDNGKRKLAYEIAKFHKGHYYLLRFLDEGKVVPELERTMRLDESVLRFLTVQVSEKVVDLEARLVRAKEQEAEQQKRAAERAAREAEEAQAREEAARQAAERAAAEAAEAEKAAVAAAAADADSADAADADAPEASEAAEPAKEAPADSDAEAPAAADAEETKEESS